VPPIEGGAFIHSTEDGDKIIFKSPDGSLVGIVAMHVRWHQLEVDAFFVHVLLDEGGGFIVEFL
jgi:hypothetical protein